MIRSKRKDEHVALALRQDRSESPFSVMKIVHQGFPNCDYRDIDTHAHYFGTTFDYPIYINAMTGGSEKTKEINRKLALIARTFNIPMAVGSQHAALDIPELEESYRCVRDVNPNGFVIGNVSANATPKQARKAIDMINADALGIHINVAQEIPMDEGDRDFSHWKYNIKAILEHVDVPVIVKEVGFGMSDQTVRELIEMGVLHVDLSGRGGTNFVWIENERSEAKRFEYLNDWGLTTIESLFYTRDYQKDIEIVASGGVQNPLDVLKCLVLGAKAVGISGTFLKMTELSEELMLETAGNFLDDFKKMMVLVGKKQINDLVTVPYKIKESELG